ncbi:type I-C CRISPR-associated protein Cas5c [Anaerococcus vaginalis]|uniref:type I-C CRISPR-associated protein Cas5c n=1 Tax=Anaerococcus vaginalis TaxID=33037 RepID=UPI0029106BE1|nr:type I-C CRISPR-associated protein Cas5c [Anaerococcus vaginalis]MDU5460925.1 type I-C CRISPR-associated protein Cas5c [Anaerococcus vaginalis]
MEKSQFFYAKIYGSRALWTSPESKAGGEKITYQIPTREALRGIIDANYFKPTIKNQIDEVRIMKKIETYSFGTRLFLKDYSSDLSNYTYLINVCYYVKFHFEWNYDRDDLKNDRNMRKHEEITKRSLKRGGRRPIFLGVSECMGYIEMLNKNEYENDIGYYDDTNLSFGIMFNGFIYPKKIEDKLKSTFAPLEMKEGRINFIKPEECRIINELNEYSFKFSNQIKNVDEELNEYGGEI